MAVDILRRLIFFVLRWSCLPRAYSFLTQRGQVTILLYHDLDPASFARHLAYLERRYEIVSLDEYLAAASRGVPLGDKKYLVITFDDGLKGNYALRDLFARHPGKVTLFLCAGIVGTDRGFWFLTEGPDIGALKRLPNQERLAVLKGAGFAQDRDAADREALSDAEVEALAGVVDIQSHTNFHPCLPFCADAEAAEEIAASKRGLEARFGVAIRYLSYPNGDYCDRDIALLKQAGYAAAITVDHGVNDEATDPFRLRRLSVNDTDDMNEFVVKATGLWGALTGRLLKPRHGFMARADGDSGRCG